MSISTFFPKFEQYLTLFKGITRIWTGDGTTKHGEKTEKLGWIYAEYNDGRVQEIGPVSSYALAVENGYTGTEEQWAENLVEVTNRALDTEAYSTGKRNGVNVTSGDPAYHNNAKFYNEQAGYSANVAGGERRTAEDARAAAQSARDDAVFAKNQAVTAKNAAVSAQSMAESARDTANEHRLAAQDSANDAETSKTEAISAADEASQSLSGAVNANRDSEAWAKGTRNGVVVDDSDPAYHKNSKWYASEASRLFEDYAKVESPTFTGAPLAPTAPIGTETNQLATTGFVSQAVGFGNSLVFVGTYGLAQDGATVTTLPANPTAGHLYKVVSENMVIHWDDHDLPVYVGDGITWYDNAWIRIRSNEDGSVAGPSTSGDNHIPVFNGATGSLLKDSGYAIGEAASKNVDTAIPATPTSTNVPTSLAVANHVNRLITNDSTGIIINVKDWEA